MDRIAVYMLKEEFKRHRGHTLSYLCENKMEPDFARYDRIRREEIPEDTILRNWVRTDLDPWIRSQGHPNSIGTILIVDHAGISKCWYLDREGLVLLPSFYRRESDLLGKGTRGFHLPKKIGTFRVRDSLIIDGIVYFLMESERFGSAAEMYIVNGEGRFMGLQTKTGFSDSMIRKIRDKKKQFDSEKNVLTMVADSFSSLAKLKGAKKKPKDYEKTATPGREHSGQRASVRLRLQEKQTLLQAQSP